MDRAAFTERLRRLAEDESALAEWPWDWWVDDWDAFVEAMERNTHVTTVCLNRGWKWVGDRHKRSPLFYTNTIPRSAALALVTMLPRKKWTVFDFAGHMRRLVDEQLWQELAHGMVASRTLTTLDVGCNFVGTAGIMALATGIAASDVLVTFRADFARINDDGARALGAALTVNRSLVTLSLSDNDINDDGVAALAAGIAVHPALAALDLGGNSFGGLGTVALARGIAANRTLATVVLKNTFIGAEGRCALARAIVQTTALTKLVRDPSPIAHEHIEAVLQRNRRRTIPAAALA